MGLWTELLGDELLTKSGVKPTDEVLAGKKVVGLYFSAHWCPPCRAFTPFLSAVYDDMVEDHADVELIFVSSDREVEGYNEYYTQMPFQALPYEKRDLKAELFAKYGLSTIPALVFLNEQGEVITKDGRSMVNDSRGNVEKLYTQLTTTEAQ
jgi:nucleoredoxin